MVEEEERGRGGRGFVVNEQGRRARLERLRWKDV